MLLKVARLLALLVGGVLGSVAFGQADLQRGLVTQLVDALNTKSVTQIRSFVQGHLAPNQSVDVRVTRYKELADHGAPFKIARALKATDKLVVVVVVDRLGNRIALTSHFENKPNVVITGLQLQDAFSVEGAPPDLAAWKDLPDLAKMIRAKAKSPGAGIGFAKEGKLTVAVSGVRKSGTKDPVSPGDVWSIGSIGKSLCSTVIGILIERGQLRWDETVGEALPGVSMDPGYKRVTLEQVMRHRGGLPPDLGFSDDEVKQIVGKASTAVAIRTAYVADVLRRTPQALPDTEFIYSNAGYAVLSHIAERVTGKPFEVLLKELVFRPLGLANSYVYGDTLPVGRARGHVANPKGLVVQDVTGPIEAMFVGAGSGIYMSVGDLVRFGEVHLKGLRGIDGLMKASTVVRLHRGVAEKGPGGRLYACGWGIQTLAGLEPFHGHNGSDGTMRAQLAIFPGANLVVVAVVNLGGDDEPTPGLMAVQAIAEKLGASQKADRK